MEIKDLIETFEFKTEPFHGCKIMCPECGQWSIHAQWKETTVDCETCNDHTAMICPKCGEVFDHVYAPVFDVR